MYKVYCDSYLIYDTQLPTLNIFNPTAKLELNKTGSFDFTVYPEHPYFAQLQKLKSIIKVFQDDYLIFRGRILNDDQGWNNERQVTCEGELAFLCDSVQRPYDFQSGNNHTTVADLFTFFINNHNAQVSAEQRFIVGNITVTDPNNYIVRSDTTYMNTWESINKKLIDSNGGYLWVRHEADGNYIDYLSDFTTISGQTIEFGKNLLDISRTAKGEDVATAIIPLGKKDANTGSRLGIESVNGGLDYVYNQEAVDRYGWIFKSVTWDDVTIAANLLTKANAYLADAINFVSTIELSAFDLSALDADTNSFRLGTYIPVSTNPHSLNQNFLIKKLSIDLQNPDNNKLTLGTTYKTFTEQTSGSNASISDLTEKIENVEISARLNEEVADDLRVSIQQLQEQTSSQISQTSTEILTKVSEDYYLKADADELIESVNTQFTQTNDEFEFRFNEFQRDIQDVQSGADAQFQEINKYIRFVDGNIVLGEEGNQLTLKIQNDKIAFLENGAEIAYWQNRKFYAVDGEFINSLQLGNFAFIPRSNGNLSFKKVN